MMKRSLKKKDWYAVLGLVLVFGFGFVVAQGTGSAPNPGHLISAISGLPSGEICTSANSNSVSGCGTEISPLLSPSGGAASSGTENHLAKFNLGSTSLTDSAIIETSDGRIGIGEENPQGKLNVVGGEVRVGAGTPFYADGSGDLYVEKVLEVGERICLNDECVSSFNEKIEAIETVECTSNIPGFLVPISYGVCDLGHEGDYKFCAISASDIDRGACVVAKDVTIGEEYDGKDRWTLISATYPWASRSTRCHATCMRRVI